MNATHRQIVRKLLDLLIEGGYIVSVWDGTRYVIMDSTNTTDAFTIMGKDGKDKLEIDVPYQQNQIAPYRGQIKLFYGEQPSVTIRSDVTPDVQSIIDQVEAFANDLATETAP